MDDRTGNPSNNSGRQPAHTYGATSIVPVMPNML
jgi:hypothetical protein